MLPKDKQIKAPGYTKLRGSGSERNDMTVEAQYTCMMGDGKKEANIYIRIGVASKVGERALDDLVENSATLTLDQARYFAGWIQDEIAKCEVAMGG